MTIKATSKNGCTLSNYYAVGAFIRANKVLFSIVVIVFGIFLNFLGSKIVMITLILIAFFATVIGIFIIVFGIFGATKLSNAIMWVILACSVIIGVCVCFLFYKFRKVFNAVLGGLTGYLFGLILYTFLFRYIESHATLVFWLVIVISTLLGILAAIYMVKHIIIIGTSLIGSYAMVRGSSFVIGGFPSEGEIIDLINRKEFDQLSEVSV